MQGFGFDIGSLNVILEHASKTEFRQYVETLGLLQSLGSRTLGGHEPHCPVSRPKPSYFKCDALAEVLGC